MQKNSDYLESVCARVAGKRVELILTANCVDADEKRKTKEQTEILKQKALSNPLVMEAIELFQGKVVDIKVT